MNETTIDENNEKALEAALNAFNEAYQIYDTHASQIHSIDINKIFNDMRLFARDIKSVKTDFAKNVLFDQLDAMIVNACVNVNSIKLIVDECGKKCLELRGTMPIPKSKVREILKQFNFRDYSEDETTAGNAIAQRQMEEALYNATNRELGEKLMDAVKKTNAEALKEGFDEAIAEIAEEEAADVVEESTYKNTSSSSKKSSKRKNKDKTKAK